MEGNLLSSISLFVWPPVILFVLSRAREDLAMRVCALMLGGIMFLPEKIQYKLPGLPHFDKEMVTTTWVFIGLLAYHRNRLRDSDLGIVPKVVFALMPVAAFGTALTNRDPHVYGPVVLPGMTPWDGVHLVILDLGKVVLPFTIGALVFRRSRDAQTFLTAVAFASIVYAPLIMTEARLSPQLHDWVYGFAQHDFMQTIRFGGFRPMVFMNHGLAVALFVCASVVATATLSRAGLPVLRFRTSRVGPFLVWVMVLCKTVGAGFYAIVGSLAAYFGTPRAQLRVATVFVTILLIYPMLRNEGLVPTEDLVALATDITDADRAQSLEFRLVNEEALYARAVERPAFGLGAMGRACVFDRWSGDEISVRDGAWIIWLGERGFVGFLLICGLMAVPVYGLRRSLALVDEGDRLLLAGVALLVGIHAFDQIPNGRYAYFGHFYAGVLAGLARGLPLETRRRRASRRRREVESSVAMAEPEPEATIAPPQGPYA